MASPPRSARKADPVQDFIDSLADPQTAKDSHVLVEMMRQISRHPPKLWNGGTIGFDAYHYRYASGREGDCQVLGFHPAKGKITVYLMDGTARHAGHLAGLGKHTTSRVCLYVKRLADVQLPVLERILRDSYAYLKAKDGEMHRVE